MRPYTLTNTKPIMKLHIGTHALRKEPICQMLATTIHKSNTTPHHQDRATTTQQGVLPQSPIVCPMIPRQPTRPNETSVAHPAGATTATSPFTASHPPNGDAFSWCSLERR